MGDLWSEVDKEIQKHS